MADGQDEITPINSLANTFDSAACRQQFPIKRTLSRPRGTKASKQNPWWLPDVDGQLSQDRSDNKIRIAYR